jgi:hypothetical protein
VDLYPDLNKSETQIKKIIMKSQGTFKNIKDVLSRDEMKSVMGGVRIGCNVEGVGNVECNYPTLLWCVERCVEIYGERCGGCGSVLES